jgi:CubicO group peptidase (beta-lactamase class C family)
MSAARDRCRPGPRPTLWLLLAGGALVAGCASSPPVRQAGGVVGGAAEAAPTPGAAREPEVGAAAAHTVAGSARLPEPRLVAPRDVGMDSARLASLDSLIEAQLIDGVAPGAALAIGRHGRLVRLAGYGRLDWGEGSRRVTDSTLYDLASLTKVVGTTTAAMILFDQGKLDLDARVSEYLPGWQGDSAKMSVTVRNLLTHTAGLPPYLPLWHDLRGKDAYFRRIEAIGLDYAPGTRTVYSDLGMILMQAIIEHLSGEPIDQLLQDRVFGPLGMTDTRYSPLQVAGGAGPMGYGPPGASMGPSSDDGEGGGDNRPASGSAPSLTLTPELKAVVERTAPTEVEPTGTHIKGWVHDENARAMGGVAGHAGLFSSARDLAIFAQMLLNDGVYDGRRIIQAQTVRRFTERQSDAASRALGWDTPGGDSSAGDYFSSVSFGHTGFTGTSIWIDPQRDLFVVLLTNRVDPTRENQKHIEFRRLVHNAAELAITDMAVTRRTGAP